MFWQYTKPFCKKNQHFLPFFILGNDKKNECGVKILSIRYLPFNTCGYIKHCDDKGILVVTNAYESSFAPIHFYPTTLFYMKAIEKSFACLLIALQVAFIVTLASVDIGYASSPQVVTMTTKSSTDATAPYLLSATDVQPLPPVGSFQVFYDELSPYGQWIDYPGYGYAFIPAAEAGFQPYTSNGHWVMTNYGWTWASGYPWGWAAFHYGRWAYDNSYGWLWLPGHQWGPAWVTWRQSPQYYGWAPMAPPTPRYGGGYYGFNINYEAPDNHYVFCPRGYINHPNVGNYYVPRGENVTIIHNTTVIHQTTVINNNTYVVGPRRGDVQRATGQRIAVLSVSESPKAGIAEVRGGSVQIYRPSIAATAAAGSRPMPAKVETTPREAARGSAFSTTAKPIRQEPPPRTTAPLGTPPPRTTNPAVPPQSPPQRTDVQHNSPRENPTESAPPRNAPTRAEPPRENTPAPPREGRDPNKVLGAPPTNVERAPRNERGAGENKSEKKIRSNPKPPAAPREQRQEGRHNEPR